MLKAGVTAAIVDLLAPIQAAFQSSSEWQEIEKLAYPPAVPEKKKKEKKDKGTRHPGAAKEAANVEAKPDGHVEGADADKVNLGQNVGEAMENLKLAEKAVNGQ